MKTKELFGKKSLEGSGLRVERFRERQQGHYWLHGILETYINDAGQPRKNQPGSLCGLAAALLEHRAGWGPPVPPRRSRNPP